MENIEVHLSVTEIELDILEMALDDLHVSDCALDEIRKDLLKRIWKL